MKKSIRMAMAFVAVATTTSGAALAAERPFNRGDGAGMRFQKADADSSGDISFEEFSAAMNSRIGTADADKDGKITVQEIAAEIEKMRAERMAKRIIARFDTNGDGVLTREEVDARQKKLFAVLDRNDDGKIERDEMPGRKGKR